MSYPSSRRRFHVRRRHPVVVADIGCGCHRKPKLFSLLNYFSRATTTTKNKSSSSYSTNATTTTITNSTFSPCCNNNDDSTSTTASSSASPNKLIKKSKSKMKKKKKKKKKVGVVEVEKDSSDPYVDFKESMVQMIVEKGIMYEWEELRELLNLFLSLNSPCHHHLILRAFTEVWEDLYSNSHRHHTTY